MYRMSSQRMPTRQLPGKSAEGSDDRMSSDSDTLSPLRKSSRLMDYTSVAFYKGIIQSALKKPVYKVEDYYVETGIWQYIAKNFQFQLFTMLVIIVNAVWLAVDTDYNNSVLPFTDLPIFQCFNNFFCFFFSFEWIVRFRAFKKKTRAFRDRWFCFDTFLVVIMVLETWIIPPALYLGNDTSQVVVAPLALMRLLRLTRLVRFLRVFPELMILVKGMVAAIRSVFFTFVLLIMVLYTFGIAFSQLTGPSGVGALYFSTVPLSMYHLLAYGVMFDNVGQFMDDLRSIGTGFLLLFLLFVFLTTFTLLNMLIGVLCEVVKGVAATEQEDLLVSFVSDTLHSIFERFSKSDDMNDTISKTEFKNLMRNDEALEALTDVNIDPEYLMDFADIIFKEEDFDGKHIERELSFPTFMEIILQLRGTNTATVKDLINLKKGLRNDLDCRFRKVFARLDSILETVEDGRNGLRLRHNGQPSQPSEASSLHVGKETPPAIWSFPRVNDPENSQRQISASEDSVGPKRSLEKTSSSLPGHVDDFDSTPQLNLPLPSQEEGSLLCCQHRDGDNFFRVAEDGASLSAAMQDLEQKCLFAISNDLNASFWHFERLVYEFLDVQANVVAPAWEPHEPIKSQERVEGNSAPTTKASTYIHSRGQPPSRSVPLRVVPAWEPGEAIVTQGRVEDSSDMTKVIALQKGTWSDNSFTS